MGGIVARYEPGKARTTNILSLAWADRGNHVRNDANQLIAQRLVHEQSRTPESDPMEVRRCDYGATGFRISPAEPFIPLRPGTADGAMAFRGLQEAQLDSGMQYLVIASSRMRRLVAMTRSPPT